MSKIVMYANPQCPYCDQARQYLKEHRCKFTEIDVADNPLANLRMIRRSCQIGVPVIEIDGRVIVGFDEEQLDQLLGG